MRSLLLIGMLAACGAGDDTTDGARGACSRGGVLESCPAIAHTAQAACTKLVQCGAIPEQAPDQYQFDWGECVDRIATSQEADLVIDCIAATSCDLLRVDNPTTSTNRPDPGQMPCLRLGVR